MSVPKVIAFDIETIPNEDVVGLLPPPEVKYGNTKDPEKRAAIEQKAKESQISGMGVVPFQNRICAFGWANDEGSGSFFIESIDDDSEYAIVSELNSLLCKYDTVVTFNGMDFDIPVFYSRALMLGIKPNMPIGYWSKRYANTPHYDIRKVLGNWSTYTKGSLDYFAKLILKKEKDEPDYKEFINMINQGKAEEIGNSAELHTKLTWELYKVVSEYYTTPRQDNISSNNSY